MTTQTSWDIFNADEPQSVDLDTCFKTFDNNGENKIDIDNFKLLCHSLFQNEKGDKHAINDSKVHDIFTVFDKNNDGFIDKNEFQLCWDKWIKVILEPKAAFIIVDVQNDFISGTLSILNCPAKQNGLDVVAPINNLLDKVKFDAVFYTLDWHPEDHISFIENVKKRDIDESSNIKGKEAKVYDTVIFAGPPKITQRLWPAHCIQGSWGSELHPDLKVVEDSIKIYKGQNSNLDSYSAFWDNEKMSQTVLNELLRSKNITDVYICGLAFDICVGYTTLDALEHGYRTVLIEECCRAVDLHEVETMKDSISNKNGIIVSSKCVDAMIKGLDRRPELGYKLAMNLKEL